MSSLYEILNGRSKFLKLSSDLFISREWQRQRVLGSLKKTGIFTQGQYETIFSSGFQPVGYIVLKKLTN